MKETLKAIARGMAIVAILPLFITHAVLSGIASKDSSLETHSELLSLIPGTVGSYLRVAFLRFVLARCHPTAVIGFGTLFSKCSAEIGANVYLGPRCCLGWVRLEDDVLIGPGVQIPSGPMTHGIERLDMPIRNQQGVSKQIIVGRDVWIGSNSVVLANVDSQSVVGAGSVVVKAIPAASVCVGNPARVIRSRGISSGNGRGG